MIEAIISICLAIVEALIALVTLVVDFIAGFFVAAGHTLTLVDLFLVILVSIAEIFAWLILWVLQLIKSAIKRQKPCAVSKPIFWRPKPKVKQPKSDVNHG